MTNSSNMDGKIFVVTHVAPKHSLPIGYEYISVGNNDLEFNFSDKSGESIAHLNSSYSELTALYWIWKNYKCNPNDFVGIMHYRRILIENLISSITKNPIRISKIKDILTHVDIIVPEKHHLPPNAYDNYGREHDFEDLDLALSIAESNDKALNSQYKLLLKSLKSAHICNILICKKSLYDEYCSWLFKILFEAHASIDLNGRNTYQKRVFGFLSERLFNVWLHKMKISKKELPVLRTDFSFAKNWNRRRINQRRIHNEYI